MSQDPFGMQPQGLNIKRLLIAGVLMFGFAMVYGQFFKPKPPPPAASVAPAASAPQKLAQQPVGDLGLPLLDNQNDKQAKNTKSIFVDVKKNLGLKASDAVRGGYEISFSSVGGQVEGIKLSGYEGEINLVNPSMQDLSLFALVSRDSGVTLRANAPYKIVSADQNQVVLQHITPESVKISRHYKLDKEQFMLEQEITIKNESAAEKFIALDMYMASKRGEIQESSFFSPRVDDAGVVCKAGQNRERFSFQSLEDENKSLSGAVAYAGFDKQYFLVSTMPNNGTQVDSCAAKLIKDASNDENSTVLVSLVQQPLKLKPQESKTLTYSSFFGPKQLNILQEVGFGLDENINFGWFGVISRPLLWLLVKIFDFVGNFGIAIILLTLLVKLVTFPLTQKSFISMQKMKKFQPDLKKLQKKYAHDRTLLGQKQMELYKQKGINPMTGCLPMLLQMPIWFALYQMLWNSVELYQQPFIGWLTNLTAPDPFYILPVAMGISMAVQTAFQPTPQDQPQMKYMMWGMPVFLTFIMLKMPAGLSLYIFVNNVLTIFQQMYIKRRYGNE